MPRPIGKGSYVCGVTQTGTSPYPSQPLLNISFLYPFLEHDCLSDFPLVIKCLERVGTHLIHSAAKVRVTLFKGTSLKIPMMYNP